MLRATVVHRAKLSGGSKCVMRMILYVRIYIYIYIARPYVNMYDMCSQLQCHADRARAHRDRNQIGWKLTNPSTR